MNLPHPHKNIFEATPSHGLKPDWVNENTVLSVGKSLEAPSYFLFESDLNFHKRC